MARQVTLPTLPNPVRGTVSTLRRVPGAGFVERAAEGTLDKVESVSSRKRRLAVYTGAGLLGVAGVVEWPVAVAGAAVAWLTQAKPGEQDGRAETEAKATTPGRTRKPGTATRSTSRTSRTTGSKPAGKRPSSSRSTKSTSSRSSSAGKSATGGRSTASRRGSSAG